MRFRFETLDFEKEDENEVLLLICLLYLEAPFYQIFSIYGT